jgi:hypothetical protein
MSKAYINIVYKSVASGNEGRELDIHPLAMIRKFLLRNHIV